MWYKLPPLGVSQKTQMLEGIVEPPGIFVTTPNMDYVPDISIDSQEVFIRADGRFYTHDFTLWPQWYFTRTSHLPFVLRRPDPELLSTHEHHLAWYDMVDADFVRESGSIADVGRIRPDLVEQLIESRRQLSLNVDALVHRLGSDPIRFRDLRYAQRGMVLTSACLKVAAQSRFLTLLTVTSFQRHYLETLAWYDFFNKWEERLLSPDIHAVDVSVMGAITADLKVAQNLYQLGVPVWLVRGPHQMSTTIKIRNVVSASSNFNGLVKKIYPNSVRIFSSPPSQIRNRISQSLRFAGVEVGPVAHDVYPDNREGQGTTVFLSIPCSES